MQQLMTPPQRDAARRRWWSAAPDPQLPPISAKRAYAEVLFVFAAFFATGIVGASLLLANRYKDLLAEGSWALYCTQAVDIAMQIGLAVVVVYLLAERRGVTLAALGIPPTRREDGKLAVGRMIRIAAWAIFALIAGGIVNALLQTGHLPTGKPAAPELLFGMVDSVQAGVIEELVVLAFVVVTLRQAGRPLWEVTLVALVLRGSYHIYYGPGVFGIVIWAAIYYWIYLRTRSLIPLVVCHTIWDMVGFLSERWPAVAGGAVLAVIALWITAGILWLAERNSRRPVALSGWTTVAGYQGWQGHQGWQGYQVWPPPGWHPDPAGHNRWRWWDGHRWTEHVSQH